MKNKSVLDKSLKKKKEAWKSASSQPSTCSPQSISQLSEADDEAHWDNSINDADLSSILVLDS